MWWQYWCYYLSTWNKYTHQEIALITESIRARNLMTFPVKYIIVHICLFVKSLYIDNDILTQGTEGAIIPAAEKGGWCLWLHMRIYSPL